MATRIERGGIEACVSKINGAIEELISAANTINATMGEIGNSWEGAAYNKAMATYDSDYKDMLTNKVPEAVTSFKDYIDNCMKTIIELDEQLAGN